MIKVSTNAHRNELTKKIELVKNSFDRDTKKIKMQRIRQNIEVVAYAVVTVGLLIVVDYALFIKGI